MKLNNFNFNKFVNQNFSFEKNPSIAIAVSGGPDSMALVFLLNTWIKSKKGEINALIVDHKLRKSSSAEAKNVLSYLKLKKIKSKIMSVKNSKLVKKNMNEARNNRYELLTNFCKKNNILHLFVGHHSDDNIETFIYRKVSGSDLEGLQSIKDKTIKNKIIIARPLINFKKKEILKFNKQNSIPYIDDAFNLNLKFTRPAIRKFLNETDKLNIKEINKDFKTIKKYSPNYNSMIWNILINNTVAIKKNQIVLNLKDFLKNDYLIMVKIINKIYKFFNYQDYFLRSKKIQILINQIKYKNFTKFNLKSMLVEKHNNTLVFFKKSN